MTKQKSKVDKLRASFSSYVSNMNIPRTRPFPGFKFNSRNYNLERVSTHIDYAPSSAGKCSVCRKRLIKGIARGWYYSKMEVQDNPKIKELRIKKLLCPGHALQRLNHDRDLLKDKLKDASKNIKKFKRMIRGKKSKKAMLTSDIVNTFEEEDKTKKDINGVMLQPLR